jgi:hypothetical protein
MSDDQTNAPLPGPDPALGRLDFFIGSWRITGRTLDSKGENVSGRATFEWLPGGFFLKQEFEAEFAGLPIKSLEIIWYDPASDTFPSTVYSNLFGAPIPYRYDVRDRKLMITTDLNGGATMTATVAGDGDTYSGGWRPNPGAEESGNVPYDFVVTRER